MTPFFVIQMFQQLFIIIIQIQWFGLPECTFQSQINTGCYISKLNDQVLLDIQITDFQLHFFFVCFFKLTVFLINIKELKLKRFTWKPSNLFKTTKLIVWSTSSANKAKGKLNLQVEHTIWNTMVEIFFFFCQTH